MDQALWETKAQIRQIKENRVHNLSIDAFAIKNNKLRLEVSAALGIKVASVVIDREKVQAIIPSEKKFYTGVASQEVLTRALKLPIHPNIFYAMIFDQEIGRASCRERVCLAV